MGRPDAELRGKKLPRLLELVDEAGVALRGELKAVYGENGLSRDLAILERRGLVARVPAHRLTHAGAVALRACKSTR